MMHIFRRYIMSAYGWEKFYEAAVRETDFRKLQDCIAKAEQAIQQRLSASPPPLTEAAELEAIGKTLTALMVLKIERARQESDDNGHRPKFDLDEVVGGYTA
jgi:hypothetical protein